VKRFIIEKRLPNLLFYGPPGTGNFLNILNFCLGKTSTILASAKELYK
jgi:DNA polymerase III delta prime subunit